MRTMRIVRHEPKPPAVWNGERARARMTRLRGQLMAAAVHYVRDGKEMTRPERLRQASNLSGIPIGVIEAEERKR